jgi:phage regulator Rha-like protein
MTQAQTQALETLKAMKFKMEKTNRFDSQQTADRCSQQPEMAMVYQEQLEYRIEQREAQIQIFFSLLKEAVKLADYRTGLYQGFKHNCVAKDLLNPTDQEYDQMSCDEIITSGYARNWHAYFPDLNQMQAVSLALVYGCAHANALEFIRVNKPQEQKQAA